jgi:hypothetical protein
MSQLYSSNQIIGVSKSSDFDISNFTPVESNYDYLFEINMSVNTANSLFIERKYKKVNNTITDISLLINKSFVDSLLTDNKIKLTELAGRTIGVTQEQKKVGFRFLEIIAIKIFGNGYAKSAIVNSNDFYKDITFNNSLIRQMADGVYNSINSQKIDIFNQYYITNIYNPDDYVDEFGYTKFDFTDSNIEIPMYFSTTVSNVGDILNGPTIDIIGGTNESRYINGSMNVPILLRFYSSEPANEPINQPNVENKWSFGGDILEEPTDIGTLSNFDMRLIRDGLPYITLGNTEITIAKNTNIGVNRIKSSFIPTENDDLTNKEYVDTSLNNKLDKTGGVISGDLTINSSLNVSSSTILNGDTTVNSSLNVSGNANLNILNVNATSINSTLNVSSNTILNGDTTVNSSLNVSGNATLNILNVNATSVNSSLNVSGNATLNILNVSATSVNSSLNVSSSTILNGATSVNSSLNVSSSTILNGATSINSSLNVSNSTILNGATSINSTLNISGATNITSTLNVSRTTNLNGITTINSGLTGGTIPSLFVNMTQSSEYNNIRTGDSFGQTYVYGGGNSGGLLYTTPGNITKSWIQMNDGLTTIKNQARIEGNLNIIDGLGYITNSTGTKLQFQDGTDNQSYMEFYRSNVNGGARKHYIGNPTAAQTNDLAIGNETTSGSILLQTSSLIRMTINQTGHTIIQGSTSINSSLNVSGTTTLNGATSINSTLNTTGAITTTILNSGTFSRNTDNRQMAPNAFLGGYWAVGFGSYNNNTSAPFADTIYLNNWGDSSGGNVNMMALNKSNIGMRIYQGTYGSSSAMTNFMEAIMANSSGNTVITGTTSLNSSLNVSGNTIINSLASIGLSSTPTTLTLSRNYTNAFGLPEQNSNELRFQANNSMDFWGAIRLRVPTNSTVNEGDLQFITSANTANTPLVRMTIKGTSNSNGGNVGIGTDNPLALLHVSGTSILNGGTSINSSLNVSGTSTLNGLTMLNTVNINGQQTIGNLRNLYNVDSGSFPGTFGTVFRNPYFPHLEANIEGMNWIRFNTLNFSTGSRTELAYFSNGLNILNQSTLINGATTIASTLNMTGETLTMASGSNNCSIGINRGYGASIILNPAGQTGARSYNLISTAGAAGAGQGKLAIFDETAGAYRSVLANSSGHMGIGTTDPSVRLHVVGDSIITGNVTTSSDLVIGGFLKTNGSSSGAHIFSGSITVNGSSWQGISAGYVKYYPSGTSFNNVYNASSASDWISIKASDNMLAVSYYATSDTRIKKNIIDIDDDEALAKLLLVQPKKYNYIDVVKKGTVQVFGFIAQQIREVIPEAITLQKDYIPSIYNNYTINGKKITINNHGFTEGQNIRVYDNNNKQIESPITVIDENTIELLTNEDIQPTEDDKVFVYGPEVNDFHNVDKNYIYTINVCATQELARKTQLLEESNASLNNQVELLNNQVVSLQNDKTMMLSEIETLKMENKNLKNKINLIISKLNLDI